jgi:hypothetical protein
MNRWVFMGLLWLAAGAPVTAGEVFKWVDKDGAVHYGDRPPDNAGAQQVNLNTMPLALQSRLRSLDPYFVITKFGGDTNLGYVCGEFDPDSANAASGNSSSAYVEPQFPSQVEATNLGNILGATTSRYTRSYNYNYDYEKCPRASYNEMRHKRFLMYEIRFNQEAVRAYRTDTATNKR